MQESSFSSVYVLLGEGKTAFFDHSTLAEQQEDLQQAKEAQDISYHQLTCCCPNCDSIALLFSIEAKKERPGTHTQGIAADIKVNNGAERFILLNYAFEMGFSGIGVAKTFIHVDIRDSNAVVWLY